MNWPEGFYNFLHCYRNKAKINSASVRRLREIDGKGTLITGSIQENLGELYTHWLCKHWSQPEFAFLQKAFICYIAKSYWLNSPGGRTNSRKKNPEFTEHLELVNISEASHLLGTTTKTIEMLTRSDQLTKKFLVGETGMFLIRKEVLYLSRGWLDPLSFKQVAVLLGLTEKNVVDLVETGLLSSKRELTGHSIGEPLTREATTACIENISKYTKDCSAQELTEDNKLFDLIEAMRLLSLKDINIITLFLWIANGKLWAYQLTNRSFRLGHLLFARSDIQALLESVDVVDVLISRESAAKYMKIREVVLMRSIRRGFITPKVVCGHTQYFDRDSLNSFMTAHTVEEGVAVQSDPTCI